MGETWVSIEGYPRYEVSDLGRVRSVAGSVVKKSRWGQDAVFHYRGRLLSPFRMGAYLGVALGFGHGHRRFIHRLVAGAFLNHDPTRSEVNHRDGDKQNNAVANLEWVSRQENCRHAYHVLGRRQGWLTPRHLRPKSLA